MHARVCACVCVIALFFSVLEQCIMECCLQFVSALHLSIHCLLAAEPDHTSSPSSCFWTCSRSEPARIVGRHSVWIDR